MSFKNSTQMVRNMLIGTAALGMYLRAKMKLSQEKNTAKAPICHWKGPEHQHSLSNPRMKMIIKAYKANWKYMSGFLKYLQPFLSSCKTSIKIPINERVYKAMAAAAKNPRWTSLWPKMWQSTSDNWCKSERETTYVLVIEYGHYYLRVGLVGLNSC